MTTNTPRWHDRYALAQRTARRIANVSVAAIAQPGLLSTTQLTKELLDETTRDRIAALVEAALLEWEDALRG